MSGTDNHEENNLDSFDLADFIEEKFELFVVMGVFAALAIYITKSADGLGTSTDSELMTTIGFASAFALSILVFVLIYKKLIEAFGDWHAAFRAHFRVRNAPLALFSLFAFVLVISISHILTRHEPVILFCYSLGHTLPVSVSFCELCTVWQVVSLEPLRGGFRQSSSRAYSRSLEQRTCKRLF